MDDLRTFLGSLCQTFRKLGSHLNCAYRLGARCERSPLSDAEVLAFEKLRAVTLPDDYRHFLSHIGNGGAGPYYGVFPLGKMDGTREGFRSWNEREGLIGVLSESFPLRDAWNDLSGRPSEGLFETNLEEYERRHDEFEKIYWNPARTNGAIPICHMGCALRIWLVVSGKEAGHLWRDGRADDTGLCPLTLKNKVRATFSTWYEEWLDDALQSLR